MNLHEKCKYLLKKRFVHSFISTSSEWSKYITSLSDDEKYLFLSLIYLGQDQTIFKTPPFKWPKYSLQKFTSFLKQLELFYEKIGGIIGYHETFVKLLNDNNKEENINLLPSEPINIKTFSHNISEKIKTGLKHLNETSFIFPVGGAGDRLNLIDKKTKQPLPAAFLSFCGKTLLEHLLEQVSALEHLYKLKYQKNITCPIILMTSNEKDNHEKIICFLEKNGWFFRPKQSFKILRQLVVPVISETGKWILQEDFTLLCKPNGHGALWKVLLDNNIFDFLFSQKKKYALIRQINNPVGGMDYNTLALLGHGIINKKKFGFLTCPRPDNSATGAVFLKERKKDTTFEYNHTNIEYCDFEKYNIFTTSSAPLSKNPKFFANTNTLFIDLKASCPIVKKNPFFEMSLNIKNTYSFENKKEEKIGRPELLMQNISNAFTYSTKTSLEKGKQNLLDTFLLTNEISKTLGSIKQLIQKDKTMETPESCLYFILKNYKDLFEKWCSFSIPDLASFKDCLKKGPSFFINISPFLGPTFEEIAKKIQKGKIYNNSILHLFSGFVEIKNFNLKGILEIREKKRLASKCLLHNITITNKINKKPMQSYWKEEISCKKGFSLFLEEESEFIAENIHFEGLTNFYVPAKHRMIIEGTDKNWKARLFPIK